MERLARDVAPRIRSDALMFNDPGMEKWATQAGNRPRMRHMIEVLASDPRLACREDALESDGWLLNCLNGTLDLPTGDLLEFHRGDHLTHQIAVEYDPDAYSQRLADFLLHLARGCVDCLKALQRIAGYWITGDTRAQKVFFLTGPTASGKSTLIRLMRKLLGNGLSVSLNPNALLNKGNSSVTNDLAMMRGKRLIIVREMPVGFRPYDSLIKTLSGQDEIQARKLYAEHEVANGNAKLLL